MSPDVLLQALAGLACGPEAFVHVNGVGSCAGESQQASRASVCAQMHIVKNIMMDQGIFDAQTRVPLILGIWGGKGQGKPSAASMPLPVCTSLPAMVKGWDEGSLICYVICLAQQSQGLVHRVPTCVFLFPITTRVARVVMVRAALLLQARPSRRSWLSRSWGECAPQLSSFAAFGSPSCTMTAGW